MVRGNSPWPVSSHLVGMSDEDFQGFPMNRPMSAMRPTVIVLIAFSLMTSHLVAFATDESEKQPAKIRIHDREPFHAALIVTGTPEVFFREWDRLPREHDGPSIE